MAYILEFLCCCVFFFSCARTSILLSFATQSLSDLTHILIFTHSLRKKSATHLVWVTPKICTTLSVDFAAFAEKAKHTTKKEEPEARRILRCGSNTDQIHFFTTNNVSFHSAFALENTKMPSKCPFSSVLILRIIYSILT